MDKLYKWYFNGESSKNIDPLSFLALCGIVALSGAVLLGLSSSAQAQDQEASSPETSSTESKTPKTPLKMSLGKDLDDPALKQCLAICMETLSLNKKEEDGAKRLEEETSSVKEEVYQPSRKSSFDVNLGMSTLGLTGSVGYRYDDLVGVRLTGNYMKFSFEDEDEDDKKLYRNTTVNFKSFGLLADVYPFKSGFRLTGGALLNGNNVQIKSNSYMEDSSGSDLLIDWKNTIKFNEVAPYLGVGFGSSPGSGVKVVFDLGVIYQGPAKMTYSRSGPPDSLIDEQTHDLAESDRKMIDYAQIFPVVGLTVGYHF